MVRTILSLLLFVVRFGNYCTGSEDIGLTKEFLKGSRCSIDSICDPDPHFSGYNYIEFHFGDSLLSCFTAYTGPDRKRIREIKAARWIRD